MEIKKIRKSQTLSRNQNQTIEISTYEFWDKYFLVFAVR